MLNNLYHYFRSVCEIVHVSQLLWLVPLPLFAQENPYWWTSMIPLLVTMVSKMHVCTHQTKVMNIEKHQPHVML